MKKIILALALFVGMLGVNSANADFTVEIRGADFTFDPQFNAIQQSTMEFTVLMSGDLVAGKSYTNADVVQIDYHLFGVLDSLTPSGFPAFDLFRGPISGAEFAALSPDSSVNFVISGAADLSDGLQVSELDGTAPVFTINARELNQNPGRFHPPILTLNSDGTGRLVNANNMSTFANPGTTNAVDIQIADEYDINLTFDPTLTLAIPEPGSAVFLAGLFGAFALRRRRC